MQKAKAFHSFSKTNVTIFCPTYYDDTTGIKTALNFVVKLIENLKSRTKTFWIIVCT